MEHWTDFFVATAGAAAALAGLMIVAMSVNVAQIIKYPQLPGRAAASIASLMLVVVVSLIALSPQPLFTMGIEIAVASAITWALHLRSNVVVVRSNRSAKRPAREAVQVIVASHAQTLPMLIGGLLLVSGVVAGEFLVFAAVIAVLPLAVLDAWVLLVEILR